MLYWKLKVLKSILLELVRKNSALSQIIYKYEIQNVAYPRELNWNMHLYTKLTFSWRPEWEKNWNRIRKQETGDFFSRWCFNLFVIFIKKTYHIKIKKTIKQNKETDIFGKQKERDREGSTCTRYHWRIVSQFAKSLSMDTAIMNLA